MIGISNKIEVRQLVIHSKGDDGSMYFQSCHNRGCMVFLHEIGSKAIYTLFTVWRHCVGYSKTSNA